MLDIRNAAVVLFGGVAGIWIPIPLSLAIFPIVRREDFPEPALAEPVGEIFPARSFGSEAGPRIAGSAAVPVRSFHRRDFRPRGIHRDLRGRPERSGKSRPGRRNGSRK